jgi:hypothetical protein
MKQLTALTMAFLLVFASCQKPEDLTPGKDISYTQADFVDNEAMVPGAEKAGNRKSDLKVVIRKVNNAENTYRLVLKVDSVALNVNAAELDPKFEPIYSLDLEPVVLASLTIPNPTNPDVDQVIFTKEQRAFRKTNENGYFVYVSDPFVTTVDFDYELVGIEYAIELKSNGLPIVISEKAEYFILPGGKSVEQDPKFANIKTPKWVNQGGKLYLVLTVTIEDDPAQAIDKVVFFPDPIQLKPEDPKSLYNFEPVAFEKTHFNLNTGLSRYVLRTTWDGDSGSGIQPKTGTTMGVTPGGSVKVEAPKIDLTP